MFSTLPDSFDFEKYLKTSATKNHTLKAPSEYLSETVERMFGDTSERHPGLPWSGDAEVRFRPGEVTIWAGANGHGKSMIISQVLLSLMRAGHVVGNASFELVPEALNKRMILQAAGHYPDASYVERFLSWADNRIWYADVRGSSGTNDMLGIVRYAAAERGVQHFCIDNLMCCVPGEEKLDYQKDFIFDLCAMARELKFHIHVVHHIRKLDSEKTVPGKFDVKGSSTITDRVDNVIIVYRNKLKESNIAKGSSAFSEADWKTWTEAYDTKLLVEKIRDDGKEGQIRLWFDRNSNSYTDYRLKLGMSPPFFEVPAMKSTSNLIASITKTLIEEEQ